MKMHAPGANTYIINNTSTRTDIDAKQNKPNIECTIARASPCACIHTCIHTYVHAYIRACIHTYIQTYKHTYMSA